MYYIANNVSKLCIYKCRGHGYNDFNTDVHGAMCIITCCNTPVTETENVATAIVLK